MKISSPFKSYSQPAKLMQPTQRSFDNPPIYSQATAVGGTPLCQNRTDVEASQLLAKRFRVVSSVSMELTRPPSGTASLSLQERYRFDQRKCLSDIVRIGSGQRSG